MHLVMFLFLVSTFFTSTDENGLSGNTQWMKMVSLKMPSE